MYCFSQICRVCLKNYTSNFKSLNSCDDNTRIKDKLSFCVPEIISDNTQLPDNICNDCNNLLNKLYQFKQMCINNTKILYDYIDKLSAGFFEKNKLDLSVNMDVIKQEKPSPEVDNEGVSMFSISLNQWDLFETKFTCRCVKDYNSFTENTSHLCQNCEGELHGFRLSKLKLGAAENRYNVSIQNGQIDDDSNFSKLDEFNDKNVEKGFGYNDFSLSQAHLSRIKKEMVSLSDESDISFEDIKPEITQISTPQSEHKYPCPICKKLYSRKYSLLNHYVESHPQEKIYHCDYCRLRFVSSDDVKKHQVRHLRRMTTTRGTKEKNGAKLNKTFPITADHDDNFSNEANLSLKKDPNDSLTCSTCDKIFSTKSNLAIHLMTHMGKQEYKCNVCGEEFFRKENFEKHGEVHNVTRKFACKLCNKSYNHKSNLKRHMGIHTDISDTFLCSICNKKFYLKDDLVEHIYNIHSKKSPEFPCPQCKKIFNHEDHLKTHVLFTHQKKVSEQTLTYCCKICKESFKQLRDLKDHEKVHSSKYKHKKADLSDFIVKSEDGGKKGLARFCPICNRTYSMKTNMRTHMLTHSNGKIRKCKICNMEFTNKFLMNIHRRTHSELMRFSCSKCDKVYMTNANLIKHLETHHA